MTNITEMIHDVCNLTIEKTIEEQVTEFGKHFFCRDITIEIDVNGKIIKKIITLFSDNLESLKF